MAVQQAEDEIGSLTAADGVVLAARIWHM